MNLRETFRLGYFSITDREEINTMLEWLSGDYHVPHGLYLCIFLVLFLSSIFGFIIVATDPPIAITILMVLALILVSAFVIDLCTGRLIVQPDRVIRESPFKWVRWEVCRSEISYITYESLPKRGDSLMIKTGSAGVHSIPIEYPGIKKKLLEISPKSR